MALRNYMYYKHEDDLKDKIAHGITNNSQQTSQTSQTSQTLQASHNTTIALPTVNDKSKVLIKRKAKKLTPTQIRKLENLKLQDDEHYEGSSEHSEHEDSVSDRSKSVTSLASFSSSDLSLNKSNSCTSLEEAEAHVASNSHK